MNKKTFWLLEDDMLIQMVVSTSIVKNFPDYKIKVVETASDVKAQAGDIILSDQIGVDIDRLEVNGAYLITMSGDTSLSVDLKKPFKGKDLVAVINSKFPELKVA